MTKGRDLCLFFICSESPFFAFLFYPMIRLSPSDAIFEGFIFFHSSVGDYQFKTQGTLDTYHHDLRFEFENNVFFYCFDINTFIYDTVDVPRQIAEFKSHRLMDGSEQVIQLSFIFHIGLPGQSRIYHADGYLRQGPPENHTDVEKFRLN